MLVFKFGGASVKDAGAIKNLAQILLDYPSEKLMVVISAMGKVTNQLEEIIQLHRQHDERIKVKVDQLFEFHESIAQKLDVLTNIFVSDFIDEQKENLVKHLGQLENDPLQQYDQVVSIGELLSTRIIAAYLDSTIGNCRWLDARKLFKTDDSFTEAKVNWPLTNQNIHALEWNAKISVCQGFIGSGTSGATTTLGREGSDYTAAIFASALNLPALTIWKDVPGVLNADPKKRKDAKLLKSLTYREAAEMTYYGAKVIHPKTIAPLARHHIVLTVRSFLEKANRGTNISDSFTPQNLPIYIINPNQILITFTKREFAFMDEKNLAIIFRTLDELMAKINMMQISATTFSICIDLKWYKYTQIRERLGELFEISYNDNLELLTIKNHTPSLIASEVDGKSLLLEQKTRKTYQALYAATDTAEVSA